MKMNKLLFDTQNRDLVKDPALMKVSKIEYQIKKHCLQNKVNFVSKFVEISENNV